MSPNPRHDRLTYVLAAVIVLMGVEIVYLVIQNRRLSATIKDPKKYFQTLSKDEVVPSFSAQDIDGNDVSVRYSPGGPYRMLFWFGPTCDYCKENVAFWERIHEDYESDRLQVLGMFAGNAIEARKYVDEHGLEFPVICADNPYIVDVYKGHVLPQTVFIDSGGTIRGVWPGILDEGMKKTIVVTLESANPQP
jgi:peroxiredoxin